MRDRKKRNIIIGSLCSLLVFMGIGYAVLSQTLNINGTANMKGEWDIKITDISEASRTGKADPGTPTISSSGVSASFEANLWMPGDSITYNITVKNNGNIDAALKELVPSVENGVQQVKFSNNAVQGKVLRQKESYTFQVSVVFDEDATEIPQDSKTNPPKYTISLTFVQYTGNELYTPINETTDNSCFIMDTAGEITGYDYNCGTVVTIPAEIDGIQVKSIAKGAFIDSSQANFWLYTNETTGKNYYLFKDEDTKKLFLEDIGMTQEELDALITSDNTYNYVKGDTALNEIELGTLEDAARIYKNSNSEIETEELPIPITELDLSHTTHLEKINFTNAPNMKKLNLNVSNNLDFGGAIFYGNVDNVTGTTTTMSSNLEELIINADIWNNLTYNSATCDGVNCSVFQSSAIDKLIVLDGKTTHIISKKGSWPMFYSQSLIKNVIIDEGITEIGENALSELGIVTVSIPGTIKSIGSRAFASNQLTNDGLGKLPSSLTSLATDAFSSNTNLTQITLTSPKDLTNWPNGGTVDGKTVTYER